MAAFLEMWTERGVRVVALDAARLAAGRAESNDVALGSDDTVSRMHAVLERYPTGWAVRDLGSSNGTFVNGNPVVGEQRIS